MPNKQYYIAASCCTVYSHFLFHLSSLCATSVNIRGLFALYNTCFDQYWPSLSIHNYWRSILAETCKVSKVKKKVSKAIPVTEAYRVVRRQRPHIYNRLTDSSEVASLTHRPRFSCKKNPWYSFLLEAVRAILQFKRLGKLKKSNDLIGNRIRDPPSPRVYNVAPLAATLPHVSDKTCSVSNIQAVKINESGTQTARSWKKKWK
jgi:hypothetical protein